MNGNSPAAQEYGHACDDAANRLIPRIESMPDLEAFAYALQVAAEGGANRKELVLDFLGNIYAMEEFGIGALKGGH